MVTEERSSSSPLTREHYRGMTCRELARAIFAADAPEHVIRQFPAQTLYMVAKMNGLTSSVDVIEAATLEQCRLMIDFDLWRGDELNEEAIWSWLGLTEDENALELLQKVLKCVDLKIIAVLIARYVDTKVLDEPTDLPPVANYHTPDKGYTWVGIKCEDGDRYFLLARLLALIFETNTELYYQLLSTPGVATESMLIEDSYIERTKRLAGEGVPEPELAAQVHEPLALAEALDQIDTSKLPVSLDGIEAIEPLLYESRATRKLAELIDQVADKDRLAGEFTYLLNAAVVRFGIDFTDQERVFHLANKVKGAINLGLELVIEKRSMPLPEIYAHLGLQKLYRIGCTFLRQLGRKANRIPAEILAECHDDTRAFTTLACLREAFPEMPLFLLDDGTVDESIDMKASAQRPIETAAALRMLEILLERVIARS